MILIDREQVPGIPLDVYFFYSCFIQHFKLEVLSGLAFTVTRSKSFMSGRRFLSPGLTTHRRSDLKLQRLSWQWNNSFLLQLEHLRSDNFSCLFHLPVPIVVTGRKTVKAGECSYTCRRFFNWSWWDLLYLPWKENDLRPNTKLLLIVVLKA